TGRRKFGATPFLSLGLALALPLTAGCPGDRRPPDPKDGAMEPVRDIHSLSRPDLVRVTHAVIDWSVDFDQKRIHGSVTWTLERSPGAESEPLILDTKDLQIEKVTGADGGAIESRSGEPHPVLGTPLIIEVPSAEDQITIHYSTRPESTALQWLSPEQTEGKAHPFLYSQAQAIHARTMIPCQDSPGVRITYDAEVRVPDGLKAVMAAEILPGGGDGEPFRFRMRQRIPSYLIALAVGDIEFRSLGPRTGVYAEPSVIERAAYEFADTESMMEVTEKLYGPYRWERYDLIVLPPSFPWGGMENPRLTFATPTILAGDRSLVSLVAHELAHSWSGNLVTNATWADAWLNEGFTVYLERRILEAIYGRQRSEMEAALGKQDLLEEIPTLEPGFSALYNTSLTDRDPDDGFNHVPYEKGYLLLRMLDEATGRQAFDTFLKRWFDDNAFQSRTTQQFEAALHEQLLDGDEDQARSLLIHDWLYEPGVPENAPTPESDAFARIETVARAFLSGETPAEDLPGAKWTTHEWQHFLRSLPDDLPAGKMGELDAAWALARTGNSEILMEWLLHTVHSRYEPAYPALEAFLTGQGRRKFLKPLYTELIRTPEGRARALAIYARARPLYHLVACQTIDKILDYSGR
ncbi:MAG: M1 family metallopeptidase, partial [Acidobacteriota bacterium]